MPEPGQPAGFIGKEMVPPAGSTFLEQDHYRIALTATPSPESPASCNGVAAGESAKTWFATARRRPGFAGESYKIDADGTLTVIK